MVLPLLPAAAAVPILADVAPGDDETADEGSRTVTHRPIRVRRWIRSGWQVRCWLRWPPSSGCPRPDVDPDLPLVELGVDSIMTVRLRRQLEKQTGLTLPPTLLWEHPAAAAVAEKITEIRIRPRASPSRRRFRRARVRSPKQRERAEIAGQEAVMAATRLFLSTLPTAVIGSDGIGTRTSGRACAEAPRSSRKAIEFGEADI